MKKSLYLYTNHKKYKMSAKSENDVTNDVNFLKKMSLKFFQLTVDIQNKTITTNEEVCSKIEKYDNEILKYFNIRFSKKNKKEVLDVINLMK